MTLNLTRDEWDVLVALAALPPELRRAVVLWVERLALSRRRRHALAAAGRGVRPEGRSGED